MSDKREPGRPRLPDGEAKGKDARMRIKPAEKAEMEAAASAAGKTFSAWAREILLAEARRGR